MSNSELPEFSPITDDADERAPLLGGLRRLFSSSKYLLVLIAIVGVVVMNLAGRISGEMALTTIGALISVAIGATAVEDAAGKVGGRPMGAKAIPVPVAGALLSALVGGVQAVLASLPAKHEVLVRLPSEEQYILATMEILQRDAAATDLVGLSLCQMADKLEAMGPDDGSELLREQLGDELYLIHTKILDKCRANPSYPRRTTDA